MVAIGFGLAAGFPVILGYIGQMYKHLSGTAFSIVITIALIGNVIANYIMGILSQQYGIEVLPYLILLAILAELLMLYFTKKKYKNKLN
jgi:MFS family permease